MAAKILPPVKSNVKHNEVWILQMFGKPFGGNKNRLPPILSKGGHGNREHYKKLAQPPH
jgi:hypothetical protein